MKPKMTPLALYGTGSSTMKSVSIGSPHLEPPTFSQACPMRCRSVPHWVGGARGRRMAGGLDPAKMASLWMGDIDESLTENSIMAAFKSLGETPLTVKIIRNRVTGVLAGYCFVEFSDQTAASKCLSNVNGKPIPGTKLTKRFKLKHALYTKPTETSNPVRNPTEEYMQAFQYYSQQFQQMFSNWKYDPKSNAYSYQQYGYTASNMQTPEEIGEEAQEDPLPPLDVDEANREFMEQSEELYEALMECHWQPLDTVSSKIPD